MNAFSRLLFCLCCLLLAPTLQAGPKSDKKQEALGKRTLALRKALEGVDKLEIGEFSDVNLPPVTIAGAEKIAALAKLFVADEKLSARLSKAERVDGPGNFCLTFSRGDKVVVSLDYYGERLVGWKDGSWEGATYLSAATEAAWPRWLKENGYGAMDQRFEEWAERRKLPQKREEAFMKCLPDGARKEFDAFWKKRSRLDQEDGEIADQTGLIKASSALLASLGKPHDAGVAICRAMGSLADPLHATEVIELDEQAATAAFAQISKYIMPTVFESALHDPQAATGAARLFFRYEYHGKVPWVLRDGVAPALLRNAVERDLPMHAIFAIRRSGDIGSAGISKTLREIAAGKIAPLTPARLKMPDEEPSLRHLAALVLARRGDAEAARLVKELAALPELSKQDQAALSISRCFLGERDTIQAGMFELNSWSIGYFGIAALEQQGDKAALEEIINGPLPASWALVNQEAVHAIQRMTGKVWHRAHPYENEVWYIKDIREWWATARDTWEPVKAR